MSLNWITVNYHNFAIPPHNGCEGSPLFRRQVHPIWCPWNCGSSEIRFPPTVIQYWFGRLGRTWICMLREICKWKWSADHLHEACFQNKILTHLAWNPKASLISWHPSSRFPSISFVDSCFLPHLALLSCPGYAHAFYAHCFCTSMKIIPPYPVLRTLIRSNHILEASTS